MDLVTASYHGRWNAWKQTERGWVRVPYVDVGAERVVITVTPRRRGLLEV
ncbi:MAG: hypothetical protein HYY05_01160 [Chloroflexi bacterium]|nr:hypothetical protein [Chloroflexota bacterium]